jgi:GNAT superfamily N-acetyltransferase
MLVAGKKTAYGYVMHRNVTIRMAQPCDGEAACDILRSSIVECCKADHRGDPAILDAWLSNKNADTVAGWFASAMNFSLIALVDDEPAGVALLTRKGKIALFYVAPHQRFSGIGKALLSAIESQAALWNLPTLHVDSTLTGVEFYRLQGYTEQGESASCFGIETRILSKKMPVKAGAHSGCACAAAG